MASLGIDIGGTKSGVGLVHHGELVAHTTVPTTSFDRTVGELLDAARQMVEDADERLRSIGIGCTGPLDEAEGIVLNDDTLDGWKGRNVVGPFREGFGLPVVLVNDADAALAGEYASGSMAPFAGETIAMLTFGTGVGGAIMDGRGRFHGAYGEHPEIGHMPIDPHGPECYCGIRGCLESLAAGAALEAACRQAGFEGLDAAAAAARSGDARGIAALAPARDAIGMGLWTLAHLVRPAAIAMGGGLMERFYDLLVPTDATSGATMLIKPMRVCPATLGNMAGVMGAAYIAEPWSPRQNP